MQQTILSWRPSLWLRVRILLRDRNLAALQPDQLRIANHNEYIAKAKMQQAIDEYRRYRKERRGVEQTIRLNEQANVRDTMALALRGVGR